MRERRPIAGPAVGYALALPAGAILALVWANVSHATYAPFAHALQFPVNDVGMVFFFALAAKEVADAMVPGGALHTWRRAALPLIAAVGGMIVPALFYVALVRQSPETALLRGWAIPCATDIAFSYLVVRFIYRRHPAVAFLLLLAIADDALGLVILAIFYPPRALHLGIAAIVMAAALLAAFGLRRAGVRSFWPYLFAAGLVSWAALYLGGLHPALALVPIVPFLPRPHTLNRFAEWWTLPVQAVLFVFALVNAGVPLREYGLVTWAVLAGLVAGKPIGIAAAIVVAVAAGFQLPERFGWRDVAVVGCASGIGFTVALFFATASFPAGPMLDAAKIGALFSLGSAAVAVGSAKVLRSGRFSAGT